MIFLRELVDPSLGYYNQYLPKEVACLENLSMIFHLNASNFLIDQVSHFQ